MSEPIDTKGLKIKVFNFLNASALEREMQNWLDSLPVDSTIQNIEYGFSHGTGSIPLVSAFVLRAYLSCGLGCRPSQGEWRHIIISTLVFHQSLDDISLSIWVLSFKQVFDCLRR